MGGPRIGSLCSGYGGLERGVQAAIGGEVAWVSDIDKGACKILAHHYPDVPNLGDLTTTDWTAVEPVDVLCAGFPCQPVSNAGKQRGDEDERWLWDDITHAIRSLRPGLIVLENVRGLLTARGGRLFGRVLGTLADLGYDAVWRGLLASDVGAPHPRFRVFIIAAPRHLSWQPLPDAASRGRDARPVEAARNGHEPTRGRRSGSPVADAGRERHGARQDDRGLGRVEDGEDEGRAWEREWTREVAGDRGLEGWGIYGPAVARWEAIIGRPAPEPTMLDESGRRLLSPLLTEWMMGLPLGHVTDPVIGLTHDEQHKALGNGVCPQQAEAAVRWALAASVEAVA